MLMMLSSVATASKLRVRKRKRRQQVAALMDRGKSAWSRQRAAVDAGSPQQMTNGVERARMDE
jgi:hypothetical protein